MADNDDNPSDVPADAEAAADEASVAEIEREATEEAVESVEHGEGEVVDGTEGEGAEGGEGGGAADGGEGAGEEEGAVGGEGADEAEGADEEEGAVGGEGADEGEGADGGEGGEEEGGAEEGVEKVAEEETIEAGEEAINPPEEEASKEETLTAEGGEEAAAVPTENDAPVPAEDGAAVPVEAGTPAAEAADAAQVVEGAEAGEVETTPVPGSAGSQSGFTQPDDEALLALEAHERAVMYDEQGDDFGDDYGLEDVGEDGEGAGDEESELVVLDPDHPLMQRFQDALSKMLSKQNERLEIERRESAEDLRKLKTEHLELGNELYNVQQELAKQQMILERCHDSVAKTRKNRHQTEMDLEDTNRLHKEVLSQFNGARKAVAELQLESDNLALRLFYMRTAKEDVRGDIAVMRRAAEKAEVDLNEAEGEKMQQDMLVDRLVEQVDRLREDNAMYDAQLAAQSEETKLVQQALSEAQLEMNAIMMEKKQLMSQWHSSLIGLQRRNEAQAAMNDALKEKQERLLSLEMEIEGYKKSILQEEEKNEKLMSIMMRTERETAGARKTLSKVHNEHESLKAEYATLTRMMQETENALAASLTTKMKLTNEAEALRKNIQNEFQAKQSLEEQIMDQMRSKLTMKKAAQYTKKLMGKMRDRSRDMYSQLALVENNISSTALDIAYTEARLKKLRQQTEELESEIVKKNTIINNLQHEINRNVVKIESKQGDIDSLNKRLEQMIVSAGGVELGPLEISVNHVTKLITVTQEEIGNLEQMWLRDQQELVRLLNEKDSQDESVSRLKKQMTILTQKMIRIESQIETEQRDKELSERSLRHLQNDMVKLNGWIFRERNNHEQLARDNSLMESDFVRALREDELASLQLKEKIEDLREEKERLQDSLIEAERQIMLWQKKIQLAEETRKAVDSDIGQGEIRAMRAEIHRMQVRDNQLERQKERLVQESVKAVSRRETIVTRNEAQGKSKQKVVTRGMMQRQLVEMRKKIKNTLNLAAEAEEEIKGLRGEEITLAGNIDESQTKVAELQSLVETLNDEVLGLADAKQVQIMELQQQQQTAKYYQQVKDGKYVRLCKADATLDVEREKQVTRTHSLHIITDRIQRDYPQTMRDLRPVRKMLDGRMGPEDSAR